MQAGRSYAQGPAGSLLVAIDFAPQSRPEATECLRLRPARRRRVASAEQKAREAESPGTSEYNPAMPPSITG